MPEALRRFKADIFQALAHPTRIAIIELLAERKNSQLASLWKCSGWSRPTFPNIWPCSGESRSLQTEKSGNQVFYSVRDPSLSRCLP